ncbi:DUF421 domain-containing protein [Pullulanibacillus sp. KACC 23026]|uniref:DUF421 domain-containing protein n=1 Tax=Pullulanibacillus sp. KACC 23026 TaxID=3028315 RepID=UPI0023B1DBDE|nr:DUF421 domain-containing protein [Pullulanibacillus sp. KACC 23026]WEG11319.1 DUF421 domain-containing protein [Pullulanibacillus sp. KACC 23026]
MPDYLLIILRCVFAFFFLLLICRILGKRQISQLTFFDYVVGIAIGSITANLSVNLGVSWLDGAIGLATWGILPFILVLLSLLFRPIRYLVEGKPTVLIENGKIQEKNLFKSKISLDELMLQLRQHNAFKLSDVELAVFETNGAISVMKKTMESPVTPNQLNMTLEADKKPEVVISQGKIVQKALDDTGFTKEWLIGELGKKGVLDLKDVYAAQVDSKGQLYIDFVNDQKNNSASSERQAVMAKLKKVAADLDLYALDTDNQGAKELYKNEAANIKSLKSKLESYLK